MSTPVFSTTEYTIDSNGQRRYVKTYYGKSNEAKPIDGVNDSDRYFEKDTSNVSIYDEEDKEWYPI